MSVLGPQAEPRGLAAWYPMKAKRLPRSPRKGGLGRLGQPLDKTRIILPSPLWVVRTGPGPAPG